MKEYINWKPDEDNYTKKGEIETHHTIHSTWFKNKVFSKKNLDRLKTLKRAENFLNQELHGHVLDAGAGNGYASVDIAKRSKVVQVHALECNVPAVDKLIRGNFTLNKIPEEKYELICGSYNDIRNKKYYDYVVCFGSLHHSSNLLKTVNEIYSSLKPGGIVIGYEPFMKDETPNSVYIKKESNYKLVQGIVNVRESDRDDHFFRRCEYFTSFHHSGFDILKFQTVREKGKIFDAEIILKKPENPPKVIPHVWASFQ